LNNSSEGSGSLTHSRTCKTIVIQLCLKTKMHDNPHGFMIIITPLHTGLELNF